MKLDVITSLAAGALELAALSLAFDGFVLMRPDLFAKAANSTAAGGEGGPWSSSLQPYSAVFACTTGVLMSTAALFDLWFPLVRGHGSGVSKCVIITLGNNACVRVFGF